MSIKHKEQTEEEDWPREGTFVLAKLRPYPHWPAVVGACSLTEWNNEWCREVGGDIQYWVYFYNSYQGEWISKRGLVPYNETNIERLCKSSKKWNMEGLSGAVDEANDRIQELSTPVVKYAEDKNWYAEKGSVVLARLEIHPPWPAVVAQISKDGKAYLCKFLPSCITCNWIPKEEVARYDYRRVRNTRVRSNNVQYEEYMKAIQKAEKLLPH